MTPVRVAADVSTERGPRPDTAQPSSRKLADREARRRLNNSATLVPQIDPSVQQPVFTITEKAPTRAFSWLKAATTAFTFKTLLRDYAKQALTPRSLNVKLGPRRNYHKGRVAIRHYANQPAHPLCRPPNFMSTYVGSTSV